MKTKVLEGRWAEQLPHSFLAPLPMDFSLCLQPLPNSPVVKAFACFLCKRLVKAPIHATTQGPIVCQQCYDLDGQRVPGRYESESCPLTSTELAILSTIVLRCPHTPECKWSGPYNLFKNHEDRECLFVTTDCPYDSAHPRMPRREQIRHVRIQHRDRPVVHQRTTLGTFRAVMHDPIFRRSFFTSVLPWCMLLTILFQLVVGFWHNWWNDFSVHDCSFGPRTDRCQCSIANMGPVNVPCFGQWSQAAIDNLMSITDTLFVLSVLVGIRTIVLYQNTTYIVRTQFLNQFEFEKLIHE